MMSGERLTKPERLNSSRQFQQVYASGRRASGARLTFFWRPNELGFNRLGLSTSKKRFKLSVWRHRLQRYLREAFRLNKTRLLPGYDIVLSVQRFNLTPEVKSPFKEIEQEMLCLAQKARLLKG